MDIKKIHQSKVIMWGLIILSAIIILLGVFKVGMEVGYSRAQFVDHFGENYRKSFVDPKSGFFGNTLERHLSPGGHGAVGKIVSINNSLIVVAGPDNIEKTIVIGNETLIRKYRDTIAKNDLKVGDFIIVLGDPNASGQIDAKLIRLTMSPSDFATSTSQK